ncbi:MAG TPA: hypothetical protein VD969_21555 [Symbiobacteriaceae bacterium]|nr:hypothetical protein [Symbiobacteriaceae bacterium]
MRTHWLYGIPAGLSWYELHEWAKQAEAADPEVRAISALEAEEFMATSHLIASAAPKTLHRLKQALRVHVASDREHGRQRAVTLMLRQWKLRSSRELMTSLIPRVIRGRFLDPEMNPGIWTDELFYEAYYENLNVCWLVQIKRYLDPTANIDEWLEALDEFAPTEYAIWVAVGRITLRRLCRPPAPVTRAEELAAPGLLDDVRAKSAQSSGLRQNVRLLEQDRKRLKAEARRQEQERKQMLSQAQGELIAARRRLKDRLHEMPGELADEARRYEAQLAQLRSQLQQAQTDFQSALQGRTANFLGGRTVAVLGGEAEANRMMVETLAGVLVTQDPAISISGEGGAAEVERQLHGAALERVQIRCDGSRRRKGRRPGIATSAFEVYIGGKAVHREYRVACCGSAAGSLMAEYGAVVMALSWLLASCPARGSQVEVWSDCRDLVDQVTGRRPMEPVRGCTVLGRRVRSLLRTLERRGCSVSVRWVRRDLVDACDRLCERAYREAAWYHGPGERLPLSAFLRSLP